MVRKRPLITYIQYFNIIPIYSQPDIVINSYLDIIYLGRDNTGKNYKILQKYYKCMKLFCIINENSGNKSVCQIVKNISATIESQ